MPASIQYGVTVNQVAERLRQAGEALRAHGWCQGATREDTGEMCAEGAILYRDDTDPSSLISIGVPYEVLNADEIADAATTALAAYLNTFNFDLDLPITMPVTPGFVFAVDVVTTWNDRYAVDAGYVIGHLEKAATWVEGLGVLPEFTGDNCA